MSKTKKIEFCKIFENEFHQYLVKKEFDENDSPVVTLETVSNDDSVTIRLTLGANDETHQDNIYHEMTLEKVEIWFENALK